MKGMLTFILCLAMAGSTLIMAQNLSKTESAIKQVIENETEYYNQRNYEKWASCWSHDDNVYWSVAGPEWYKEIQGWEDLNSYAKENMEKNPDPLAIKQKKSNYNFSVSGNMAFVTFEEDGSNSTRVLTKEKGNWRILRMGVVNSGAFKIHMQKKMISSLKGVWQVDPASVTLEPEEGWELKDGKWKVMETNQGVKMYGTVVWKMPSGEKATIKTERIMAMDDNSGMVAVMQTSSGPFGNAAASGKCYFKEDAMWVKIHVMGSEKALSKEKMSRVSENVIGVDFKYINDKGEVGWTMHYNLVKNVEDSLALK